MNLPKRIILRVKTDTDINHLSTAILREVAEFGFVQCTGIGAGPMNQVVKAVARARVRAAAGKYDLIMTSEFSEESPPGIQPQWVRVMLTVIRIDREALAHLLPGMGEERDG